MGDFYAEAREATQREDLEKLRELFMSPEAKEWDRTILKANAGGIIRKQTAKVKDGTFTDFIWSIQGMKFSHHYVSQVTSTMRTLFLAMARLHDSGMEWVHPTDVSALVASKDTTIRSWCRWLAGRRGYSKDNDYLLWKKGERGKIYYRINMEGGEKW